MAIEFGADAVGFVHEPSSPRCVSESDTAWLQKLPPVPIKVAVFPLLKNKPELMEKARGVFSLLQKQWPCFWDTAGAIGRRYRRQDEIGTPCCVTVDFDTLEDGAVTVRDRDTTTQERVAIEGLREYFLARLGF
jgi:glycyl-tRNA synthetase